MSIVEKGGPALDPSAIRRTGYVVVAAAILVGVATLFVKWALMAVVDIALAAASLALVLSAPALFEIKNRKGGRVLNLLPSSRWASCSSPGRSPGSPTSRRF